MTRGGFVWLLLAPGDSVARVKVDEKRMFDAINRERKKRSVPALVWNLKLAEMAQQHSANMASRRFFSHVDPKLGDLGARLTRAGISYRACAENIFQQMGGGDPVATAVHGWMESAGHHANIVNRVYRETGIGAFVTNRGECFVTQAFVG